MMKSSGSFSEEKLDNCDGIRRLHRGAGELVRRLDGILKTAKSCEEIFQPEVIILRTKLKDCCERLMFGDPAGYGKKAEDLLWRKVFYDVILAVKQLRKNSRWNCTDEATTNNHIMIGFGTYHHLMFRLQTEFNLPVEGSTDFLFLSKFRTTRKGKTDYCGNTKIMRDLAAKEWAATCYQRCLICLGDLARYHQELFGKNFSGNLSERYYGQAASHNCLLGMPHNQLGTLAGNSNFGCDAAYHYMRCLISSQTFEGSEGNLERVFERSQKVLSQCLLEPIHTEGMTEAAQRELIVKRCLTRFLKFCEVCFFDEKCRSSVQLEQLCQQVLQDFFDCMQFSLDCESPSCEQNGLIQYPHQLDDVTVCRLIVMALMCVHWLYRKGSNNQSAAIAFSLAMFSHLLHYVVCWLQSILGVTVDGHCNSKKNIFDSESIKANGDAPSGKELIMSLQETYKGKNKIQHKRNVFRRRRRRKKLGYSLSLEDSDLSEAGEHSDDGLTDSDDGNHASDISEREETEGEGSSSEDGGTDNEITHQATSKDKNDNLVNGDIQKTIAKEKGSPGRMTNILKDTINSASGIKQKSKLYSNNTQSKKYSFRANKFNQYHSPDASQVLDAIKNKVILSAVKICTDWLKCHPDIFTACAQGSLLLWSRLATLLNMIHPVLMLDTKDGLKPELLQIVHSTRDGSPIEQTWPLPEDVALHDFPLLKQIHNKLLFNQHHRRWFSSAEEAVLRAVCLHQFGHQATHYSATGLVYDHSTQMFYISESHGNKTAATWPSTDQEHKNAVEVQRKQLMENMAHLWLQAEVNKLETTVHSSSRPHWSPYLVLTTLVLTDHLLTLRQLLTAKRFVVVIPHNVIQHLDWLKKDSLQAREAIRWLEAEFHHGNRYLRSQKQYEQLSLSPIKYPKRKDKEAWDFFQILECCNYLSQQGSSALNTNLVTLLVGAAELEAHQSSDRGFNMMALTQSTGIHMESIEEFFSKWQSSIKSQR